MYTVSLLKIFLHVFMSDKFFITENFYLGDDVVACAKTSWSHLNTDNHNHTKQSESAMQKRTPLNTVNTLTHSSSSRSVVVITSA